MKTKLYTETANADEAALEGQDGFTLETVRVVRRHERFPFGAKSGKTIGQIMDDAIRLALESGDELQDIAVHFERSDWTTLRDTYFNHAN